MHPRIIEDLINEFSRFPGIGPKTAQRFVFYLLKKSKQDLDKFCEELQELKKIKACDICQNFSEREICSICQNKLRDHATICLVANSADLETIEKTGDYKGTYQVLGGLVNTAREIKLEDLNISHLLNRLRDPKNKIKEIIFALSPNLEGEATLLCLLDLIKKDKTIPKNIKLSRLAKGLSFGTELEYADSLTLSEAINNRRII